ncbi:MAG TPA: methionine synthase, partial [Deltaproteobacteria bacterium]|nr:methionine synthase [Deltaproteobacteria bacterium]HQM21935.1 methionine synthase [Deltaproteobacteria bacterium]
RQVRREGLAITSRRFSAGYGDFELENQRIMYERLRLGEIGVEITDSCILIPEKSVTAVAGIRAGNP